jgi:hypothetical protein
LSDTKETKPRPVRVFENDLKSAEYVRSVYIITALPDTLPANYLEPETWAHVPELKLRQGDRIEILAADTSWYAELLVRVRAGTTIHLELLQEHKFDAVVGKEHDDYEAAWAGGHAKWRVLRKSDRFVMVDKLAAKSEAVAWIEANSKPALKAA